MVKKTKKYTFDIQTKRGVYEAVFKWEEKDNVYIVTIPSLPSVFTFGKSIAKARKMAKDAIELYCDCLIEDGKAIVDDKRRVFGDIPASRIFNVR